MPMLTAQRNQATPAARRLYGRATEIAQLHAIFQRAAANRPELVFITGHSGLGKTSLAQSLTGSVAARGGYLAIGKFEEAQRDVPYKAIVEALRSLARQIRAAGSAGVNFWRPRLVTALGDNADVVIQSAPEFGDVLGPMPRTPWPVAAAGSPANRFHAAVCRLVTALAREQPLVLCLDDLHWSDPASLLLIAAMLTDPDCRHLLVVGTYRPTDVESGTLLTRVAALLDGLAPVTELRLEPLGEPIVTEWIADTLGCGAADAAPLARILAQRTGGNALFIGQLIDSLVSDGLIQGDPTTNRWRFDLAAIREQETSETLATLLADRLADLPPESQRLLAYAAMIAGPVETALLAAAVGTRLDMAVDALSPAVRSGLIVASADLAAGFGFAHDRIREAAERLVPEAERSARHLVIGRLLRGRAQVDETKLFDAVRHLNRARALIEVKDERDELLRLTHRAARKAAAAFAFDVATNLYAEALTLCDADGAAGRTARLTLCREAAATAYRNRDEVGYQRLMAAAEDLADSAAERAELLEVRAGAHSALSEHALAMKAALEALAILDFTLPAQPTTARLLLALVRLSLRARDLGDAEMLPELTDSRLQQIMRLLLSLASAAYLAGSNVFVLAAVNGALLTLTKGASFESGFLIAGAGTVLIAARGHVDRGYAFGKLATMLGRRFGTARPDFSFAAFIQHWRDPIHATLPLLASGFERARIEGDWLFADYFSGTLASYAYFGEPSLAQARATTLSALDFSRRRGTPTIRAFLELLLLVHDVLGGEICGDLDAAYPEFKRFADLPPSPQNGLVLGSYFYYRAHLALLLGRNEDALNFAAAQRPFGQFITGQIGTAVIPWYEALALTGLIRTGKGLRNGRRRAERILKTLRGHANHAPANHRHRVLLLEAELATLKDGARITAAYRPAIDLALQHGFTGDAALAAERAAARLAKFGDGAALMAEAAGLYQRWGARMKLCQLSAMGVEPVSVARPN